MSNTKLKILSVFLSIVMTVGMNPVFVLAEDSDSEPKEPSVTESSEEVKKEKPETEPSKPAKETEKPEVKETEKTEVTETEPTEVSEKEPAETTVESKPETGDKEEPKADEDKPEIAVESKDPPKSKSVTRSKKAAGAFNLQEGATATAITLRWDPIPNATGYEVWRADTSDGTYVLMSTDINLNEPLYFDAPLEAGKYYFYRIVVHIEGEDDMQEETSCETDLVEINADTFPDEVWREYVTENYDKNNSGGLNSNELYASISIAGLDVKNMKGVEWFTGSKLTISGAKNLSSLDLSKNNDIIQVEIRDCNLKSLNGFKFGPKTKSLDMRNNSFESLTVSEPVSLESLDVRFNPLKSLDVSSLTNLWSLDCAECKLSTLDVSKNTKLEVLRCQRNNLTSLDVSNNEKLDSIDCTANLIENFKYNMTVDYDALYLSQNNIPLKDLPVFGNYSNMRLNSKKLPQRWMTPKYISQLKVTATTANSISLEWEKIESADGYYVFQAKTVNDTAAKAATLNGNDKTSWTVTGLTTGNSYYFYVLPFKKITDEGEDHYFTSDDFYEVDEQGVTHTYHNGVSAKAEETAFTVSIATVSNGEVKVDNTKAKRNTIVGITVKPNVGYKCTGITVKTDSGNDVNVADNNAFIMPGENVTVSATFEMEEYYFNIIYDERVFTVTGADYKDDAHYGDKYEFTVEIKPGIEDFVLDYVKANQEKIKPDENGVYHVEQPAENLFISVVAREKDVDPTVDIGDTSIENGCEYTVTNNAVNGTGTAALTDVMSPAANVSVPSTVIVNGVSFKVTKIAAKAFYNNTAIKTVYVGPYVNIIEAYAFYGCKNLVKISGCKGLKTVGSYAFACCPNLKSFAISSSVLTKLGYYAFYKDGKLKTIYIKYTTKLTKSGVKKSLKGSSVKTVKVKKSKIKKYKKYFKKSNSGRKVKVKK